MRNPSLTVVVALVLAACKVELQGAPCDSDENCPSGQRCTQGRCAGAPAGNNGDGGSGDGGADGGIDLATACRNAITFVCDRSKASGCLAAAAQADCPAIVGRDMPCDLIAGMVRQGFMIFDPVALDACLGAEKSRLTCGRLEAPKCDQVVRPVALPLGSSCPPFTLSSGPSSQGSPASACARGAQCRLTSNACMGTCVALGNLGDPCSPQAPCNPDLGYCAYNANSATPWSCSPFIAVGSDCSSAVSDGCGPLAFCTYDSTAQTNICWKTPTLNQACPEGVCLEPAACELSYTTCVLPEVVQDGSPCSPQGWPLRCGPDSYCLTSPYGGPGTCVPKSQGNGPCSSPDQCAATRFCNGQLCEPRRDLNAACTANEQCLFGLWCSNQKCSLYAKQSQGCALSSPPIPGSVDPCLSSVCAVPAGATNGTCAPLKLPGDSCAQGQECQSGRCMLPSGTPSGICSQVCTY